MDELQDLFKRNNIPQLILILLIIIYFVAKLKPPSFVYTFVDQMVGKILLVLIVIYLFVHANPILAVLFAIVAFELIYTASLNEHTTSSLHKYAPSEQKKQSQLNAFNQFPYTLEQEIVAKMAPLVHSGTSFNQPSYKPLLDNLHDASPLNKSN
jgi:hypothetical protein